MKDKLLPVISLAAAALLARGLSRYFPGKKTWKTIAACLEVGIGPVLLVDLALPLGRVQKKRHETSTEKGKA